MSIPNRFDIVQAVNAAHPTLIARNTRETASEFLWRVVSALAETDDNFGFLSKSAAENHIDIPGAGMVSIDALCYRGEHNIVDIIGSAGDGPGTGGIGWSEDEDRRPSNLWVEAVPYPDGTQPPDPPDPPDPGGDDLTALKAQVLALTQRMGAVEADASAAALDAKDAQEMALRANERIGNLKARGLANLPVVVDGFRARARGDVELRVTE